MLGVPVTNISVSALQPTTFDGSASPTNGIYISGPFTGSNTGKGLNLLNFTMFDYNESTGLYTGYPVNGGNVSAPLVLGNGYRVFVRDGGNEPTVIVKTLSVKGTLVAAGPYTYTGLVNVAGTKPFSSTALPTASTAGGWNLISNPYMSEISIDMSNGSFWTKSNISNTSYIYNGASRDFSACASGVPTGNCKVAAFQAFFVKSTGSPALTIKEAAKVSATNTTNISRVAQSSVLNYLGIKLTSANSATVGRTYIRFTKGADYAHDEFDGMKLGATNRTYITDLGVYSKAADNQFYDVNAKPYDFLTDTTELNVKLPTGKATLDFSDVANLESGYSVSLYDKYISTLSDMNANPAYNFTVSADSNSSGPRFQVIFNRTSVVTNLDEASGRTSAMVVYPSPTSANNFHVAAYGMSNAADMYVYDLTGRVIYSAKLKVSEGKISQMFDLTNLLAPGVYTTVVKSGGNTYNQKVLINK